MRWRSARRSTNIEDRRGQRPSRVPGGAKVGGGLGFLVLLFVILVVGGDPTALLQMLGSGAASPSAPGPTGTPPPNDVEADFISAVLGSTEDVWSEVFADQGARYQAPTLVLFTDVVQSACGFNTAATGPFYCPPDQRVYLDLGFFRELSRMGGSGDFAAAYVVGHEVGHHIQNLVGTSDQVRRLQSRSSQVDANRLSVLLELQADCYAGVWAHYANQRQRMLEPGDVDEGMDAAEAIGDDRLMRRAGRAVHPESFTHGTSAQRKQWLRVGLETGSLDACDTFARAGR